MSYAITNIQLTARDTVNFYQGTEIVRNLSQIVPSVQVYMLRNGGDIIIFQPAGSVEVLLLDGTTSGSPFIFSTSTITKIGTRLFTPVDQNDPDSTSLNNERAIEVYNYLAETVFKACCDCGEGGGCSVQYVYDSGLTTGSWYFSSGLLIMSPTSYLSQNLEDFLLSVPDGSYLSFFGDTDPTQFVVFGVSNASLVSGLVVFNAAVISGTTEFTNGQIFCFNIALLSPGGGATYIEAGEGITITGDGSIGDPYVINADTVSSQNWQDTLIVGSTLTQHNTIAAGNFDFIWNALRDWTMAARSFLAAVTDAISLRTTGSSSTFIIRHDATTNPLQVDVNSSGGTLWNTAGPTRFIGDTNNEVDLETTGFGDRHNNLNFKATNDTGTDTPNDRGVISFQNNKNDGNGMREWFALRHTDLSTIEVFGLYAYDPANSGVLNRWVICVAAGAFSNPYSNNTILGQILNPVSVAYPFPNKVDDLIQNGSLILLHKAIDVFNNELLAADNSFANSPIIRFVPRVWVDGDPTELFGAVKHAYVFQQQFSTDAEDTAWQVGFKDAELDALPALARSFLLKYSGDAQFGAYPSSRNDGTTSIAFYPGPDGELLVGPVSGGGSGTVESVTGDSVDNTDPDNPVVNAIPYDASLQTQDIKGVFTVDAATGETHVIVNAGVASSWVLQDGTIDTTVSDGTDTGFSNINQTQSINGASTATAQGNVGAKVVAGTLSSILEANDAGASDRTAVEAFTDHITITTPDVNSGIDPTGKYLKGIASDGSLEFASIAAGFTWTTVVADGSLVVNQGVKANKVTLLTLTLPVTAAENSIIEITGINTGLYRIAQNSGQLIHFGNIDSTTGATGYVESTLNRDSIKLLCVVADTEFQVLSSVGNFTIV